MTTQELTGFTVLIEFEVPADRQRELVQRLSAQIGQGLPGVGGFRSATVQASADGRSVINYARWDSRAAWETATGLDAADLGERGERAWAENQRDQWFAAGTGLNPVAALLAELGAATSRVTAFEQSVVVTA
jgi:hypothetical protein